MYIKLKRNTFQIKKRCLNKYKKQYRKTEKNNLKSSKENNMYYMGFEQNYQKDLKLHSLQIKPICNF